MCLCTNRSTFQSSTVSKRKAKIVNSLGLRMLLLVFFHPRLCHLSSLSPPSLHLPCLDGTSPPGSSDPVSAVPPQQDAAAVLPKEPAHPIIRPTQPHGPPCGTPMRRCQSTARVASCHVALGDNYVSLPRHLFTHPPFCFYNPVWAFHNPAIRV